MNIKRVRRISSEIKKVISSSIINSLKDPRIDKLNVSVTDVKVTNDLSFATVYIAVIGDDEKKKQTLEGLNKAKGFLKTNWWKCRFKTCATTDFQNWWN